MPSLLAQSNHDPLYSAMLIFACQHSALAYLAVYALGISGLLRGVASNGGPFALTAVHDELLVRTWLLAPESAGEGGGIEHERAAEHRGERDVDRAWDLACGEFGGLAHVDKYRVLHSYRGEKRRSGRGKWTPTGCEVSVFCLSSS